MALEFLALAPVALQALNTLTRREPAGMQESLQAARDARTYSAAAVNPMSPHFQAMEEIYRTRYQQDAARQADAFLRLLSRRNARRAVNPERLDEGIAQTMARLFEDASTRSRESASQALMNAATGQRGATQAFSPGMTQSAAYDVARFGDRADLINAFGSILGGKNPYTQPRVPTIYLDGKPVEYGAHK